MRIPWCVLVLLAVPAAAAGQRVLFLEPEAARIAAGAELRVRLEAGGKPAAWEHVKWVFVHAGDAQENMDVPPKEPDAAGLVTLPCPADGPAVVGVDFKPVVEEIESEALREFAAARCDEKLPAEVRGKVRVGRVQSCKAVVRVGDGPGAAAIREGTQAAEIALRIDPTRGAIGSDIAFSASLAGEDLEDARVLAVPAATGKVQDIRTRAKGMGRFALTEAGAWRVEFHHLERAAPGGDADWVLTSGTLTFTAPGAKP